MIRLFWQQLTFRVAKGRQRDGPLQAQRLAVPVKSAEHIKKLLQHLQLQVFLLLPLLSVQIPLWQSTGVLKPYT